MQIVPTPASTHMKQQIKNEAMKNIDDLSLHKKNKRHGKPVTLDKELETKLQDTNEQFQTSLFYLFLLNFIKSIIKIIYFIKLNSLQFYYFIYFNLNLNDPKSLNNSEDLLFTDTSSSESIVLSVPRHVCVILNEHLTDNDIICKTFSAIIDSLSNYGVETITFYKFESLSGIVKETIIDKYQQKDLNNNNSVDKNGLRNRKQDKTENNKQQKRSVNINFMSNGQGGRGLLVKACKNIAVKVKNSSLKMSEIDQDLIETHVLGKFY